MTRKPKTIKTLLADVDQLMRDGVDLGLHEQEALGRRLGAAAAQQMRPGTVHYDVEPRMSKLGLPDRRLWYEFRRDTKGEERDPGEWRQRMVYGGIIEEFVLFLVERAGHLVENRQREVILDGVPGHIDCTIDGPLVDVKSASPFSFHKFVTGRVMREGEDPFGYVAQLSAYNEALGKADQSAYWLVINKSTGELALIELDPLEQIDARTRVGEVQEVRRRARRAKDKGPDRCYPLEPVGKSGNMALSVNCQWCPFKKPCYSKANDGKGIRSFQYAGGKVIDLAKVVKEPAVPEVTKR